MQTRINNDIETVDFASGQNHPVYREEARRGAKCLLENQRTLDAQQTDGVLMLYRIIDILKPNASKQDLAYDAYSETVKKLISTPNSKEQTLITLLKRSAYPTSRRSNNRETQQPTPSQHERISGRARSPTSSAHKRHRSDDQTKDTGAKRSKSRGKT